MHLDITKVFSNIFSCNLATKPQSRKKMYFLKENNMLLRHTHTHTETELSHFH